MRYSIDEMPMRTWGHETIVYELKEDKAWYSLEDNYDTRIIEITREEAEKRIARDKEKGLPYIIKELS